MGIHSLSKLIGDHAQAAIREYDMKSFFGRKIAIDASMSIYQFLIAVRQDGAQLATDTGETTSHLQGLLYRTIRMIDNGIKPVYVFDGKPPQLKSDELAKRSERREEAKKDHEKAIEEGDAEAIDKFSRRLVKVTRDHNDECKKLLKLMGVPYVEAPCEAEAQCAAMVKENLVYATGTEDMDALTYGSSVLLRHMTFSEAKKMPIKEFQLTKILSELALKHEEFVDLCILLGCDYCDSIRGIGPKRAIELITQHRTLENIVQNIDPKKYPVPESWPYQEARKLFLNPDVKGAKEIEPTLKWTGPDEEGLVQFLVEEKQFNEDRIRNAAKKLAKMKQGGTQGRIDNFFKVSETVSTKRKAPEPEKKSSKKTKVSGGSKKKK